MNVKNEVAMVKKIVEETNCEDSSDDDGKGDDEHKIVTEELKNLPSKLEDCVLLTYQEVDTSPDKDKWKVKIDEENQSLVKNKTWTSVDRKIAIEKIILSSRRLFVIREDSKYKARLFVRGCEQEQSLAPTILPMNTVIEDLKNSLKCKSEEILCL